MLTFKAFQLRLAALAALALLALPAMAEKPLVVFLVHGLGGDGTTFGQLDSLLASEFGNRIVVKKLLYDTKSPTKSQTAFVHEIAPQMAEFYRTGGFDPERDPFVFVVHSQGGILARNYLAICVVKKGCDSQLPAPKNPQLLFTLGTPHWGSPMGNRVSDNGVIGKFMAWAGGKMYAQNKQLSIGSTLMVNDRLEVIYGSKGIKYFLPNIRVVSVAGNVGKDNDKFSFLMRQALAALNDIEEDDIIVPTSQANPDFHYYVETQNDANGKVEYQEGDVNIANEAYIVRQPHVDFAGSAAANGFFEGLAAPRNLNHTALFYLLRELARHQLRDEAKARVYDQKLAALASGPSKVREFSSEVIVSMPIGYQRKPEAGADFLQVWQSQGSLPNEGVIETPKLPNSLAFKSYGLNQADFDKVNKPYFAYYHAGRFAPEDESLFGQSDKRARLCYSLQFTGFRYKTFCTTVRPGEASFARVILEPYQPIEDARSAGQDSGRFLRKGGVLVAYNRNDDVAVVVSTDGKSVANFFTKDELISRGGLPGEAVDKIGRQCAVAVVGPLIGIHKGVVYGGPADDRVKGGLRTGDRVEILGRIKDRGRATDRYVFKSGGEFVWINAADVDVIENESCTGV